MTTTIRARIYARGEVSFVKFLFLTSWFAKLLEANFLVLSKLYGCQVGLPNCWSCSDAECIMAPHKSDFPFFFFLPRMPGQQLRRTTTRCVRSCHSASRSQASPPHPEFLTRRENGSSACSFSPVALPCPTPACFVLIC
jgi:hypothetical protein